MLRYVTPLRAAAVLLTLLVVSLPTADAFIGTCYDGLPKNMVLAIQEILQEKGFNPGSIDGLWGRKTQMALSAYQNAIGVRKARKLRGIPNGETLRALFGEQFKPEKYGLTRSKHMPNDIFEEYCK